VLSWLARSGIDPGWDDAPRGYALVHAVTPRCPLSRTASMDLDRRAETLSGAAWV